MIPKYHHNDRFEFILPILSDVSLSDAHSLSVDLQFPASSKHSSTYDLQHDTFHTHSEHFPGRNRWEQFLNCLYLCYEFYSTMGFGHLEESRSFIDSFFCEINTGKSLYVLTPSDIFELLHQGSRLVSNSQSFYQNILPQIQACFKDFSAETGKSYTYSVNRFYEYLYTFEFDAFPEFSRASITKFFVHLSDSSPQYRRKCYVALQHYLLYIDRANLLEVGSSQLGCHNWHKEKKLSIRRLEHPYPSVSNWDQFAYASLYDEYRRVYYEGGKTNRKGRWLSKCRDKWRNYLILILVSEYGLRLNETIALTLDVYSREKGELRITSRTVALNERHRLEFDKYLDFRFEFGMDIEIEAEKLKRKADDVGFPEEYRRFGLSVKNDKWEAVRRYVKKHYRENRSLFVSNRTDAHALENGFITPALVSLRTMQHVFTSSDLKTEEIRNGFLLREFNRNIDSLADRSGIKTPYHLKVKLKKLTSH